MVDRAPLAPLPPLLIEPVVWAALLEDLGRAGDITTDAVILAACRTRACDRARRAITPDSPDGRLITSLAAWDRLDRSAAGSRLCGGVPP